MTEVPLRRQLRRRSIRLQAKLEAGWGDRWIPLIVGAVLGAVLINLGLARLDNLRSGPDLAAYTQSSWLLAEGYLPKASLFGTDVHLLELHWSFILYPLALIGSVSDPARALIVTQGLALAAGVPLLWRLCRRAADLRIGSATAIIVAYAIHPATHQLGVIDFHPETIAVPALFGVALFSYTNRWFPYWIAVAIVLACRADFGFAIAIWGVVLLGSSRRIPGLWTIGIGVAWTLGLLLVAQPLLDDGASSGAVYGEYGNSLTDAIFEAGTHPIAFIDNLLSETNTVLLISLLFPLIFLPLLSLRHVFPALPLTAVLLVATTSPDAFAERAALLFAFMMIGSTFAISRLGNRGVDRIFVDGRVLAALVAAAFLGFVSQAPNSPYRAPWDWNETSAADASVIKATLLLDADDAVRASPTALASLAERRWLYELSSTEQPQVIFAIAQVRAVLIDERTLPAVTVAERDIQRSEFSDGMRQYGFEIVYADKVNGVWLFYRS